jgi:hypothetical protein
VHPGSQLLFPAWAAAAFKASNKDCANWLMSVEIVVKEAPLLQNPEAHTRMLTL